jgi:catechol 2,3-dioxygenase-like lactoylglutathione lyase family enzyme
MLIKHINHITINVRDVESSLRFYRDVLGLEQLNTVNMGDHELYYLALPGGTRLELTTFFGRNREAGVRSTDSGIYRHIAFEVDDISAVEALMQREGLDIVLPVTWVKELGVQAMLAKDPNGVELEFIQKSSSK